MARVPKSAIKLPSTLPPIPSTSATPARSSRKRSSPDSSQPSPSIAASASTSGPDSSPRELRAAKRLKKGPVSEVEGDLFSDRLATVVAKEDDESADSGEEVARDLKGKGKATEEDQLRIPSGGPQSLAAQRRAFKDKKAKLAPLESQQPSPASDKATNSRSSNQTDGVIKILAELRKMKDEVQCSICLSTMIDPYTIGCGHSFCRRCLHNTWHRVDDPPTPPADSASDEGEEDSQDGDDRGSASGSGSQSGSDGSEEESEEESEDEGAGSFSLTMNGVRQTLEAPPGATRAQGNSVMDAMRTQMFRELDSTGPALDLADLRAARVARIEGRPLPAPAPAPRANAANRAARAAAPPAARMPPTGAERAAKVVCPSCRYKLTHEPPIKVFALSMVCDTVRAQEQAGGALASDSEDGKAGNAEDEGEGVDENDKTWGGLFHDSARVLTRKEARARDARPMRDDDDDVWRCGACNWEVEKDSGECTNESCMHIWDPTLLEDDDDDADDLMNPAGPGGFAFGDGDRSEDDRSEDEELNSEDEGFIDDGAGDEQDSAEDPLGSDNDSATSTPRKKAKGGSYKKRKEERRKQANGRKSAEVIDVDSTDASGSESDDDDDASVGSVPARNRIREISDSDGDNNSEEEPDTSLEIVAPARAVATKDTGKKRSSSDEEKEDEDEVAQPPARGRGAAKPAQVGRDKRRRVIIESDEE